MNKSNDLHFRTHVQLKNIIGKDLINDDNIAILELVKNSFDADAKKVHIEFLNIRDNDDSLLEGKKFTDKTSRIIIRDNGRGMNFDDLRDKWLNIAYSEKKINTRQHNRMMAGAKGVGRFSCDRLGEYLNLYTRVEGSNSYILLIIDWKKFEVDDDGRTEIQSIDLKYEYLSESDYNKRGLTPFKSGVLLEIIKLRRVWAAPILDENGKIRHWDVSKFILLKKYLEKLINPNQAFENNDFGININVEDFIEEDKEQPEHDKFIGGVENRIFDKLDFKSTSIESEIIDGGKTIKTTLKDKGETIFWLTEKNHYYPLLKDVKIYLFYLNPYAKAFFTRQTGIRSVDYGSIFLFINGFRVSPYGELGNDWLGIDQRKAQGHSRYIGLREFIGRIEILDRASDFQIISSREGVVRNDNYEALTKQEKNKSFFFKTLRRLERFVVDGLAWDSSIYDPKDIRFKQIETKIISGEISEEELEFKKKEFFKEDENIKKRRVYDMIHSIISAKADDVIELYINEALILDKVNEEKEKSEAEFEQLLEDFESKKIDPDALARILKHKASQNQELQKQLSEFAKYTTSELTSKALLDVQSFKDSIERQSRIIAGLQKQLEQSEKEKEDAEKDAEAARRELSEAREQNLFLKSVKSQDFNEVVNLMHQVGVSTSTVQNYISGVVHRLDTEGKIENDELKKIFSRVNYEVNKISSISKFATKANFRDSSKSKSLDLVSFIEQYIINIVKPFLPSNMSMSFFMEGDPEFVTTFKPLEMIIVIDNLISNAKKASASKIEILVESLNDNSLEISFKDNGIGIPKDNQGKIFEYGFTTTDGSGLGLTHVKEIIEKIGGIISLDTENIEQTEFKIHFKKK